MSFSIAGRPIGKGHSPFVIAELSGNHNGELSRALALIDAAKATGADAVKLQTYTPDTMTIDSDGSDFRIQGGPWDGRILYDLYGEAQTPWEWHKELFAYAKKQGIICFSTPFDETAVDFLERLDVPAYKIASFELVDTPLIRYVARTGKPLVMSTGMGSFSEIDDAVAAARESGAKDIVLLHCISAYPAPAEEANLSNITALAERYGCSIGLSDHTLSSEVSVAAVALGAVLIEKHITLARSDGGPDAAFSLEPSEFTALVNSVRTAYEAIGTPEFKRAKSESESMVFRRSLYAVKDIASGDAITRENVRSIRPGYGLAPKHLDEIIGRKTVRALKRGTPISLDALE